MHSGYILSWRKKIRSDVWKMPPMYMRVFEWIIHSANHEKKVIPTPAGALTVEPGQRVTSLRQIAEGVAYFEYGVERIPNTKTISVILDWLKSNGMITLESNAKGTVVSVIKWNTYNVEPVKKVTQSKQPEVTEILHGPDTNKNEYNEKKEDIGDKSPPPSALMILWNQIIKEPKVTSLSRTRETKCRLRLKERSKPEWEAILKRIASTPFLQGKNDRGWRADFDWLIANDTNATKVIEGKYDNGKKDQLELPQEPIMSAERKAALQRVLKAEEND